MQPSFVSSRCMAEAAPLSNFVMKVIIHMLMCYITIESVFGTARQRVVIHPKETILLSPWKLNLLIEKFQSLHQLELTIQKIQHLLQTLPFLLIASCLYMCLSVTEWSCLFVIQMLMR